MILGERPRTKPLVIFPNAEDVALHDFTGSCNGQVNSGLCVCPPGQEFVAKDQACGKAWTFLLSRLRHDASPL
jgi:hypothetical protein